MRPLINLASDPFRNRRLFWLFTLIVLFVSSLLGLEALDANARLKNQIAALEPTVKRLDDKVKGANGAEFADSSLTLAQNEALLAAQDLITRKGFSWSQLLNDLEVYIPNSVRVTQIAVDKVSKKKGQAATSAPGAVMLSFNVVGKSSASVTQMILELNRSERFAVNPRSMKPIEGMDDVEFQLEVEYRPRHSESALPANTQVAAQRGEVRR